MATNKTSKSAEAYFARYKTQGKQASNRRKKLEKLSKLQPNNTQVALALQNIGYRRCTPKTHVWDKSMIQTAKVMKKFMGKFDKHIFHADPKVSQPACTARNQAMFDQFKLHYGKQPVDKRSMFSIGVRTGFSE